METDYQSTIISRYCFSIDPENFQYKGLKHYSLKHLLNTILEILENEKNSTAKIS